MGRPKLKPQQRRDSLHTIRLSEIEERFLALGASREPTGPQSLGVFLRRLAMQRTVETTGVSFLDFQAAQAGKAKVRR